MPLVAATSAALALLLGVDVGARTQTAAARPPGSAAESASTTETTAPQSFDDPFDAYAAGRYDIALQKFVDRQVERPDDPAVALNLGATHYKMKNYEEADRALATAALASDTALREEALYNLGNSAYRQDRLGEAVELYKAALEINPEDEDAKFNLEFVRNEIRRRHEEAQKRQQQGEQSQQDQGHQQEEEEGAQGSEQQSAERPQQQTGRPDQDQDGLPDDVEREGENPTDPSNPDTDGDGLPDGAEDLNRNDKLDPGETDPNRVDSDGDGIPDAEEVAGQQTAAGQGDEPSERLTEEEAKRYLQGLQEGSPQRRHPGERRRRSRPAKDW